MLNNGEDERKPFAKTGRAAGISEALVAAISLGAVFMGAMTYIGNGPNFMVKSIAESTGVKMPSFFGFVVYSCAVLLPILVLHDWLFF
jgi:Na+/H+ antiporter NhaD/arsenite permease-like protein